MNALHLVRVPGPLGIVLTCLLGGVDLQAQVGISSGVNQVLLAAQAPSRASMPAVSAHRKIGRRGDLTEAAVQIRLLANGGYRLVARGNAGATSRVWIHIREDQYQELIPGAAMTLPGTRPGSSEREVRYLTDGSASAGAMPVRFELVIDPVI